MRRIHRPHRDIYRRHDSTAFRASGPLRPVDVMTSELKPSDATDAACTPLLLFSNGDCRISLSRRGEAMPFFTRHVDGDLLCFVHTGVGLLETEFAPLHYRVGDWIYLPKACTWRQVPDAETTLLMVEANEFRLPPPGRSDATSVRPVAGHHSGTSADRRRRPRRVRGPAGPRGRPDIALPPTQSDGCRGLARRQLPVYLQHRRLQRRGE